MRSRSAFLLAGCVAILGGFSHGPNPSQLIRDVRVFDGERVLEHRSVLVLNGKIERIGGAAMSAVGAEVIDGAGRTLLPGLIDAHVHIPGGAGAAISTTESALHQALVLGVTTQLDMFTSLERLRVMQDLRAADRPDLSDTRTAGIGVTAPGGHPTQMGGPPIPTLARAADARAFVEARLAEGADYIKVIHDDSSEFPSYPRMPTLDVATMRAVVAAAHQHGKLVIAHAMGEQLAREAIDAGVDGLAHLFIGDAVSPDFGRFAARHRVFVVPTLSTLYLICGKSEGPAIAADAKLAPYISAEWRPGLESAGANPGLTHLCAGTDAAVRELVQANVPILTGTDSPVPGSTYGASVHAEMTLLVRDGLTPVQALAAATSVPARWFRLADRGSIRPGLRADLVLVQGDPTTDILATRNIVAVWTRGVRVAR